MRAFVRSCAERLPERMNSESFSRSSALKRTTYFFTAISFPVTNHPHRCGAAIVIQKSPSKATTEATSLTRASVFAVPSLNGVEVAGAFRGGFTADSATRIDRPDIQLRFHPA
jgi:hypothetical protein